MLRVPAVTGHGYPATSKPMAPAGMTSIPSCVPLRKWAASVAVRDWLPAVNRVALKVCDPLSPAVNV